MRIVVEVNSFDNLLDTCWGQAIDTLKFIDRYALQDELMEHLECLFGDYCEEPYSDTQLNDYLAYEFDEYFFVAEHKHIDDIDDLDELEDYASQLDYREALATIREAQHTNKEELLWDYISNNYENYSLEEVFAELTDLDLHTDLIEDE